jgi:autotransporter-associated beta strand protein
MRYFTGTVLAMTLTVSATRAAVIPFVDNYKNNTTANNTEATNPVLALLSGLDPLWTTGSAWYNGTPTAAGVAVLNANIAYVGNVTQNRTSDQATMAYYDDRRNQSYSIIDGMGPLTTAYLAGSGATTTILTIPADATSVAYNDGGTGSGVTSSALGNVVSLVNTLRGSFSSTTPPKNFFLYPRPYRQIDNAVAGGVTVVFQNGASPASPATVLMNPSSYVSPVVVLPTLVPVTSGTPGTDSGFPSGHTNAGFLASLAMAYAMPERFQELLTRASELGNDRILAGMHSPLDVMAGRMEATALAAAILNDPANAALKAQAYSQAQSYFEAQTGTTINSLNDYAHSATTATDRFADYATNKTNYDFRLTYGFSPINSTTVPMSVPKGAEVLLETRQPYLSAAQRREVLRTTALPSGYPLLDDPEGWGRLNLFAAADGYGSFDSDVMVTMDASQGGFNAKDSWRNNIGGVGKFTKLGTGMLTLTGNNSYTGGTEIDGGTLVGESASPFGDGDVLVAGGTLAGNATVRGSLSVTSGTVSPGDVTGTLSVDGNYTQGSAGILNLVIGGTGKGTTYDVLSVHGGVSLGGTIRVSLANGFVPMVGQTYDLLDFSHLSSTGYSFDFSQTPNIAWNTTNFATTGAIVVTAVPEPASCSVLLVGAALLIRRRAVGRIFTRI